MGYYHDSKDGQLPYNPNDVDIRQQSFAVHHIVEMIKEEDIYLQPEKRRRRSEEWNKEQKSRLIESLIMRIPLPIFYLDGSRTPWRVIDGTQRLKALYEYIEEQEFGLVGLEYLKNFERAFFSDLPFNYQRAIQTAIIEAYIINPGTPERIKQDIFLRINPDVDKLSVWKRRRFYYRGAPMQFIDKLARDTHFLDATGQIALRARNRDEDREYVLRFVAFFCFLSSYRPPYNDFLEYTLDRLYDFTDNELKHIYSSFKKAMDAYRDFWSDLSFLSDAEFSDFKKLRSIDLFEIWSVHFGLRSGDELEILMNRREYAIRHFMALLKEGELQEALQSTSFNAIEFRFRAIHDLINNVIYRYAY
ncbi:DUF262 domain-containing protein [uncultured Odoribacter sp.]|uniref:DUF262 domain-containing protein n=1 Tax=uncultured Odoribacter sp. TaxID=876416 RepID=UPI0026310855|nr:DUF262 domain-containing protein [uncultured Odoribacter sp.]